jgi:thermostable 8-oxoguanine DNA glycosylase
MTASFSESLRDHGQLVTLLAAPGVARQLHWGHPWQHGTAAYWVEETRLANEFANIGAGLRSHQLGHTLAEEVAACILGGWGMPYEIGLAAFEAVRADVLSRTAVPSEEQLLTILSQPFDIAGHPRKYRFARQRSARLAAALSFIDATELPANDQQVRDHLLQAPGIGMKTASWIVRNHWGSSNVAVLDVHVIRAGVRAGIFDPGMTPVRHYREMEGFFIAWANTGAVRAADLDAVIWAEQASAVRGARVTNAFA